MCNKKDKTQFEKSKKYKEKMLVSIFKSWQPVNAKDHQNIIPLRVTS